MLIAYVGTSVVCPVLTTECNRCNLLITFIVLCVDIIRGMMQQSNRKWPAFYCCCDILVFFYKLQTTTSWHFWIGLSNCSIGHNTYRGLIAITLNLIHSLLFKNVLLEIYVNLNISHILLRISKICMYILLLIFIHDKFLSSCLRLLLIYCHLALQHIFKLILLFIPITRGNYRIIIFHLLELPSA